MAMHDTESELGSTSLADRLRADTCAPADACVREVRPWLDWAATQIGASLAADEIACRTLLAALEAVLPTVPGDSPAGAACDVASQAAIELSAEQKMSAVVVAVQSHDRLMQQITHVAAALQRLYEHLGVPAQAESREAWVTLRETQTKAFSMSEERALFAGIVGGPGVQADAQLPRPRPSPAVDLFDEWPDPAGPAQ